MGGAVDEGGVPGRAAYLCFVQSFVPQGAAPAGSDRQDRPRFQHWSSRSTMWMLPAHLVWVTSRALPAGILPTSSNFSKERMGPWRPGAMTGGSPLLEFTPPAMDPAHCGLWMIPVMVMLHHLPVLGSFLFFGPGGGTLSRSRPRRTPVALRLAMASSKMRRATAAFVGPMTRMLWKALPPSSWTFSSVQPWGSCCPGSNRARRPCASRA